MAAKTAVGMLCFRKDHSDGHAECWRDDCGCRGCRLDHRHSAALDIHLLGYRLLNEFRTGNRFSMEVVYVIKLSALCVSRLCGCFFPPGNPSPL